MDKGKIYVTTISYINGRARHLGRAWGLFLPVKLAVPFEKKGGSSFGGALLLVKLTISVGFLRV